MRLLRHLSFAIALAAGMSYAGTASAESSFYGSQCAGCHGTTPTTCNGCHEHGGNVSGRLNKTSFAPGETVSVTVTAGTRTGWWRAAVIDGSGAVLQRVKVASGTTATIPVPAPGAAGSYTWRVAWYGNGEGGGGGSGWIADAGNPGHGYRTAAIPAFTVASASAPAIALEPASLQFGSTTVGTPRSLVAQVRNTGTAPLAVTGIARCASPATSTEFTWSPAAPLTVAAGATATLNVTYAPSGAGADTGCLAVTSNAANAPTANLAVAGTGVVPAAPRIAVTPASLSFGDVTAGESSPRTFTISNGGTAPLTGSVSRAAATSAEYTASPASFTVAPGASQVVTVTYAPGAVGSDAGAIVVASNDAATPSLNVALSGAGIAAAAPNVALDPTSVPFGAVTVGGTASRTLQVRNTGNAPLVVSGVARCASPATSAEFTWSPAGPFTVAAGGSTTVTVTYAPTNAGTDGGCIAFTSNDAAEPVVSADVSGTGQLAAAPRIAVSPAALSFGSVTLGTSSPRTVTISNGGNAVLTGTLARAAGTSAEYGLSTASFSVAAGASQTFTVTYAPSGVGADAGAIVLASNDPASPAVSVPVSASGVAAPTPAVSLAPPALAFGAVAVGEARSLAAEVRNTGAAPLEVASLSPCAGTSAAFSWAASAPLTIPPGGSATVAVTYRPAAAGTDAGCVAVASNDPASAVVNLGLSGSAAAQPVPAIALLPDGVDFGTAVIGTSVSRPVEVRNTGTGPLAVARVARCDGTAAAFAWSPPAPFAIAPGAAVTLTATYAPTAAASDAGCLVIESDDPANPAVRLAVAGAGASPPVPSADADLDIDEIEVPRHVRDHGLALRPRVELENDGRVGGTAPVRLTATLGGVRVYDETLSVTLAAGAERTVAFPAYLAADRGTLRWTATVADADSDSDRATARTVVGGGRWSRDRDDFDDRGDRHESDGDRDDRRRLGASLSAPSPSSGGCASGAGASGLALLGLALAAASRGRRRAPPRMG
jgi:hypothetical protein